MIDITNLLAVIGIFTSWYLLGLMTYYIGVHLLDMGENMDGKIGCLLWWIIILPVFLIFLLFKPYWKTKELEERIEKLEKKKRGKK